MNKFKVFLHQYVEEIGEVEVEAEDYEQARDFALELASEGEVDWSDGNDSYEATAYKIVDSRNDAIVWEKD